MYRSLSLFSTVAIFTLAGLAALAARRYFLTTLDDATVTVTGDVLSVSPNIISVSQSDVTILWGLDAATLAAGWRFTSDGISMKDNSAGEFYRFRILRDGIGFALKDLNSIPGDYPYNVKLKNANTGRTISIDPSIRNNPSFH